MSLSFLALFRRMREHANWPLDECFEMFCQGVELFGPFFGSSFRVMEGELGETKLSTCSQVRKPEERPDIEHKEDS